MADDYSQRPYRSNEQPARGGQARPSGGNSGSDPLAELARLIGQNDPFGEYGRDAARQPAQQPQAAPPALDWGVRSPAAGYPQASQPAAHTYAMPDYDQQSYAGTPVSAGHDPYDGNGPVPAYLTQQGGHGGYEADPYSQGNVPYNAEEQDFYDDVPPSRRRMGIVAIAGIFALAVLGTAGAFGYRALFGSSGSPGQPPVIKADTSPSKIVPANNKDTQSNKLITDRLNDRAPGEKIVSREEQPVAIKDKPVGNVYPAAGPSAPPLGSGIVGSEPKKVHTIAIHPDQTAIADATPNAMPPVASVAAPQVRQAPPMPLAPAAAEREPAPRSAVTHAAPPPPPVRRAAAPAPGNAPLSLNPNAAAARRAPAPTRTASATPTQLASTAATGSTGGYAVQVTSQRSEADAHAAFRSLQGKYPNQLGGRRALIHRVDLGAKGIYFRAMVGPFANAGEASGLCSSLKAAGGQCIVQRN